MTAMTPLYYWPPRALNTDRIGDGVIVQITTYKPEVSFYLCVTRDELDAISNPDEHKKLIDQRLLEIKKALNYDRNTSTTPHEAD